LFDNVVVANKTIDKIKIKKKRCVIVKVDYEKTYDSINGGSSTNILEVPKF